MNLKCCLLVSRIPLADTDKELVVINLHLEAYDNGEGKEAQTRELLEVLRAERKQGNYYYMIDGFIVSDNIRVDPDQVMTLDMQFKYSDHNPVKMSFTLLP